MYGFVFPTRLERDIVQEEASARLKAESCLLLSGFTDHPGPQPRPTKTKRDERDVFLSFTIDSEGRCGSIEKNEETIVAS